MLLSPCFFLLYTIAEQMILYAIPLASSLFVFSFLLYQREYDEPTLITMSTHPQSYLSKSVLFCGVVFRKHTVHKVYFEKNDPVREVVKH